jgi:hypothetical protein
MKPRAIWISLGLALSIASCDRDRPPVVRNCDFDAAVPCPNLNDPMGRIEGTLIYQGPPPPAAPGDGRSNLASGRVVLLLFEYDNPPPPQGSASTAVSFQTVSAAQLFQNATVLPDGNVRATIAYSFPGIARAGEYQIRAFYSRTEQIPTATGGTAESGFHPLFGVRNLPVRGDVGGGALVDPSAAIPVFAKIVIGEPLGPDARGRPRYRMPEEGYVARNVTVFIGKQFPTERPMFQVFTRPTRVPDPRNPSATIEIPGPNRMTASEVPPPPTQLTDGVPTPGAALERYASDWGLLPPGTPVLDMVRNPVITDAETGSDVPQFTIGVNLPMDECAVATLAGVRCATDPLRHIGFFELALDRNENGTIDLTRSSGWADAHPTLFTPNPLASATDGRLPWLYPLVLLTKLHEPTEVERRLLREGQSGRLSPEAYARLRSALNRPESLDLSDPIEPRYPTIVFGSIVPSGVASNFLLQPWTRGYQQAEPYARVMIVPIAVEVHGPDRVYDYHAIIPPATPDIVSARTPFLPPTYRCHPYDPTFVDDDPLNPTGIPWGRYGITLIGPGGQAWSVPNDLATFPAPENAGGLCSNGTCRAPSQGMVVRIRNLEPPRVRAICPTPASRTTDPTAPAGGGDAGQN